MAAMIDIPFNYHQMTNIHTIMIPEVPLAFGKICVPLSICITI